MGRTGGILAAWMGEPVVASIGVATILSSCASQLPDGSSTVDLEPSVSTATQSEDVSKEQPMENHRPDGLGQYVVPAEDEPHEGTWLNWPHSHTYGTQYRDEIEPIWVQMVQALAPGERVHIVVYDEGERARVMARLAEAGVDPTQVDYVIAPSNDVWSRDTGPIFAVDAEKNLKVIDFAFDGWGKKTPYTHDDAIPQLVAKDRGFPIEDIPNVVLEGGSVEIDGAGTLMATKSSVISEARNPGMAQAEAEDHLRRTFGVANFIWLEGSVGEDITDAHIDGFARFYDRKTILTLPQDDFLELYEQMPELDYDVLKNAKNADGDSYALKEIPLTKDIVTGTDEYGTYLNYYIGNQVVLLPVYGDEHDDMAVDIIKDLYPTRRVVPIDVSKLFKYGGMIHCVTQQQPLAQ